MNEPKEDTSAKKNVMCSGMNESWQTINHRRQCADFKRHKAKMAIKTSNRCQLCHISFLIEQLRSYLKQKRTLGTSSHLPARRRTFFRKFSTSKESDSFFTHTHRVDRHLVVLFDISPDCLSSG
jgi:hypothetical protein